MDKNWSVETLLWTTNIVTFNLIKQNEKAIIKVPLKDKDISVKSTVLHYTTTDNEHNYVPTFQKENRNFGCHFRVPRRNAKIFWYSDLENVWNHEVLVTFPKSGFLAHWCLLPRLFPECCFTSPAKTFCNVLGWFLSRRTEIISSLIAPLTYLGDPCHPSRTIPVFPPHCFWGALSIARHDLLFIAPVVSSCNLCCLSNVTFYLHWRKD